MIETVLALVGAALHEPYLLLSSLNLLVIVAVIVCLLPRRLVVALLCLIILGVILWRLL